MDIFYRDGMADDAIYYAGGNEWTAVRWIAFASRMAAQRTPVWSSKFTFIVGIVYKGERGVEKEIVNDSFLLKARDAVESGVVLEIFVSPQFEVRLYYFNDPDKSISSDSEAFPYKGVFFDGSMALEGLIREVICALLTFENRTKKYILTTKATALNDAALKAPIELRFRKNSLLVTKLCLLRQLMANGCAIFIRPKHCSYSHSSSLIMRHFEFPDIDTSDATLDPTVILDRLMHPNNVNSVISNNIKCYVESRDAAIASTPVLKLNSHLLDWRRCCERCVEQLAEVQATLPTLYHYNEQTRRQLMDIVLRQACILNGQLLLVENTLCAKGDKPPEHFVGTGPVDYTFGGGSLVVSVKDKSDADGEEEEEGEEEQHVGSIQEGKDRSEFNQRKATYQALSEVHDLLYVGDVLNVEMLSHAPCTTKCSVASNSETYARRTASSVLTSGQRYRVFHVAAPIASGGKPTVYYGGEYPLHVLRYRQDVGLAPDAVRGDGRDSGLLDHQNIELCEVKGIIALLSLAGSGKLMSGDVYQV